MLFFYEAWEENPRVELLRTFLILILIKLIKRNGEFKPKLLYVIRLVSKTYMLRIFHYFTIVYMNTPKSQIYRWVKEKYHERMGIIPYDFYYKICV